MKEHCCIYNPLLFRDRRPANVLRGDRTVGRGFNSSREDPRGGARINSRRKPPKLNQTDGRGTQVARSQRATVPQKRERNISLFFFSIIRNLKPGVLFNPVSACTSSSALCNTHQGTLYKYSQLAPPPTALCNTHRYTIQIQSACTSSDRSL